MACTFQYNRSGEIIGVRDQDGKPSKLYRNALEKFQDKQLGLDIVAASLDENYQGSDKLQEVLDFIARENKNKERLSVKQTVDFKNTLLSSTGRLIDKLNKAFYKGELFNPTYSSLSKSGIYNAYEIETILGDTKLQKDIKSAIEALNNTEIEEQGFESITNLVKLPSINSFGKQQVVNPYVVEADILKKLGGIKDESVFNDRLGELEYPTDMTFEEAQNYSRVTVFPIEPTVDTKSAVTLAVKDNISEKAVSAIRTILNTPDSVAAENKNDIDVLLGVVQTELAKSGLDVIGIENDRSFLKALQAYLLNPSTENINTFTAEYNRFFNIDNSPKELVLKLPKDRNYVYSVTNKPEDRLLVEDGLLKAKENLYIKVRRVPIETLKNIVKNPTSERVINVENEDYQEELSLLKQYFKLPMNVVNKVAVASKDQITEKVDYLLNDYVADFQIRALKEKLVNSDKWQNFYSNFEINKDGINLKNNDPITIDTVNIYLNSTEPLLKQYSMLSKQLPFLGEVSMENIEPRDVAVNNPLSMPELKEQGFRIDERNIIAKNADQEFVRVGNRAYEAIETKNGMTLYAQLPSANESYTIYRTEKPTSEIKLEDYTYLNSEQVEPTQITKGKENIIKENFDCI